MPKDDGSLITNLRQQVSLLEERLSDERNPDHTGSLAYKLQICKRDLQDSEELETEWTDATTALFGKPPSGEEASANDLTKNVQELRDQLSEKERELERLRGDRDRIREEKDRLSTLPRVKPCNHQETLDAQTKHIDELRHSAVEVGVSLAKYHRAAKIIFFDTENTSHIPTAQELLKRHQEKQLEETSATIEYANILTHLDAWRSVGEILDPATPNRDQDASAAALYARQLIQEQQHNRENQILLGSWNLVGHCLSHGKTISSSEALALASNLVMAQSGRLSFKTGNEGQFAEAVWNALPADFRANRPTPQRLDDLVDLLNPAVSQPPAQPRNGCNHPEQLADALLADAEQEWADSITRVEDLIAHRCPPPLPPAPHPADPIPKLFSTKEVPEFTEIARYWDWRVLFRRFALSQDVHPTQFNRAFNRILQAFNGKETSPLAAHWNVASIMTEARARNDGFEPDWQLAWEEFIRKCDARFKPHDQYSKAVKKWYSLHARDSDSPEYFFVQVDTTLWELQDAAALEEAAAIEPGEVFRQFMKMLHPVIRNECIKLIPQLQAGTLDQHRQRIKEIWSTTTIPRKEHARPQPSQQPRTNRLAWNPEEKQEPRNRTCGLRSSYDDPKPAVPQYLRGSVYFNRNAAEEVNQASERRNQAARRDKACEACRRPLSQHPDPSKFKEVREFRRFDAARALPAPATIPEERRITAAPTRQSTPATKEVKTEDDLYESD